MNFSTLDIFLLVPEITLFVFSLIPLFIKVFSGNKEPSKGLSAGFIYLGGIIALAGVFTVHFFGIAPKVGYVETFGGMLKYDSIALWTRTLVLGSFLAAFMFLNNHWTTPKLQRSEFYFILCQSVIGAMLLCLSNHLMSIFISLELMSLCLYVLIALSDEETYSKEAAVKYFILGSAASAIILFGFSLFYGTAKMYFPEVDLASFNIIGESAAALIGKERLFTIGLVLMGIGFLFKVGAAPFHSWSLDVYQGSATPLTMFMSTAVKVASFSILMRYFATSFFLQKATLFNLFEWVALLTLLVGSIGALMQTQIKRLMAYSSITHTGYILIGLIALGLTQTEAARAYATDAVLFYLFSYVLTSILAFGFICYLEKTSKFDFSIEGLKGYYSKNPTAAVCISAALLSFGGIPPLVGFFGKFYVFSTGIQNGLFWLVVWGALASVVSIYYYLRPVVYMFFYDPVTESNQDYDLPEEKYSTLSPQYLFLLVTAVLVVVSSVLISL